MGFGQVQTALTEGSGIAGAGRPYTAELWDGFDPGAMDRDPALGHYFQDDFMCPPTFAANSAAGSVFGNYNGFTNATAGGTIGGAGLQGGGVKIANTTTSEMSSLQMGAVAGLPFVLATAAEDDTWPYHHVSRVRMEARFAVNTVTASAGSWFLGLAGVLAALDLDNTTGDVVTSKNFFGFHTIATAPTLLRFIYQAAADAAPTVVIASTGTLIANTWFRVGFDFDPSADPTERCSIWFNGVKASTFITHASAAAATFPRSTDGAQAFLAPTFMSKSIDGSDAFLYLGGFRISNEPIVAQGKEACA
jgi:hypothetical protein